MDVLIEFLARGFMVMLSISMPCVLMAAMVGIIVGILQAVTSVQEQTIAAAPKIVIVFLTIVVLGGYYIRSLSAYFHEGVHIAFQVVPKNDTYVLPHDYYKYTHPFANEMNDKINDNSNFTKRVMKNGEIPWDAKATKHSVYIKSQASDSGVANFLERLKINGNK